MTKTIVKVECAMNKNGQVVPKRITWKDGRKWGIDRLWTSCDVCLRRMHISGNFKHMSPDDIRKTVNGMSKLVALYVKGEAS